MKSLFTFLITITLIAFTSSCSKDEPMDDPKKDPKEELEFGFGAFDDETNDEIPTGIYFGNGNLPTKHDLSYLLPPIGNQGSYGTCVSWALGYNLKTMIEAQDKNYSSADLADPSKQASPKDLFLAIPKDQTGQACSGTYLYSAMDAMQNRGVATMATVPYTNLGDCSQSTQGSWDNEAQSFKIQNYRSVDLDINSIKQQIANDKPVGFGARLGDNFMDWNSDQVLNGHTSFDRVGQHAGHAMTIIGYDDDKGANGAFRVINSWGEGWGNYGFIWIDYNFFVSADFANVAYTATNKTGAVNPDNPVNPTANGNIDLIPYGLYDDSANPNDPTSRTLSYNVFNLGTETAKASSDWAVSYLYYNAFDANDYGILLHDYYTDDYNAPGQNGDMGTGPGTSGNWWNHVDVPGNSSISMAVAGTQENFNWAYQLPNITGYYYLIMIADTYDVLDDKDTDNNYYYITDNYGWPIYFNNGRPDNIANQKKGSESRSGSVEKSVAHFAPAQQNAKLRNAYTKAEIQEMIKAHKTSGKLQEAISKFQKQIK